MTLRWDVLIGVFVYLILLSIIVGVIVLRKGMGQSGESYLYGDKKLGPWLSGVAMGVACIGALHCAGYMESASTLGMVTLWFTVPTGILFVILGTLMAPIYRKMGYNTIPEIFSNLFDHKTRMVASLIGLLFCFNLLSLETQGGAIIVSAITGIDLRVCLYVFMFCAFIYLLISGMWQVAYLNIINTAILYIGIVIAFIIVTMKLPGGWSGVDAFYAGQGLSQTLSFWSSDINLLLGFAFAITIGQIFTNLTDQGMLQYILTAKDAVTARKASFIAILVNTPFGCFTIAFGLAAWAIPQFASHGPKTSGFVMLLTYLPTFVVILVLAGFLVAVLSTWARCTMGISQIIINDFYLLFSKAENKEKFIPILSRLLILIVGLGAIVPAYFLPHMMLQGVFTFSLGMSLFGMMVIGLFWKRNSTAAFITMLISIIGSFIWEYSNLAAIIGAPGWFGSTYLNLIIILVFGVGLTYVLPGTKGFFAKGEYVSA